MLEQERKEHTLVCLSSSPSSINTIQVASKIADTFKGQFTALYVENRESEHLSKEDKERLEKHIKIAEKLGAEIVTTHGEDVLLQINEYARMSNVTRIVVGRRLEEHKLFSIGKSFTERLIQDNPEREIYIVPDKSENSIHFKQKNLAVRKDKVVLSDIVITALLLALCTWMGLLFFHLGFTDANIITVYLLGVLLTSILTKGYVCSVLFSFSSVVLFNYFMTEPRLTLYAYGSGYPVTFIIMLTASILSGTLASKLKDHAKLSAQAAFRTQILFDTNQLLQKANDDTEIIEITCTQLTKLLSRNIVAYTVKDSSLSNGFLFSNDNNQKDLSLLDDDEKEVAKWVLENKRRAGATSTHFNHTKCLYLAIRIGGKVYGVVGIPVKENKLDAFEYSILLSILGECALALDNARNAKEKEVAAIRAKDEQLRADLLRSISHDLRTPLTSISGNASTLLYLDQKIDDETRKQIYTDIYDDSEWLTNVVENLLSVTRLNDGKLQINLSLQVVEDVIDEALKHVNRKISEHHLVKDYSETILLANMDARLIIQVIINLVDNAIKYTPVGSTITVRARKEENKVKISVIDDGPGIKDEQKPHIFEMFFTGQNKVIDSQRSLGLGLALCKSIINTHGGELTLTDAVPHGCNFTFTLESKEVNINEQ